MFVLGPIYFGLLDYYFYSSNKHALFHKRDSSPVVGTHHRRICGWVTIRTFSMHTVVKAQVCILLMPRVGVLQDLIKALTKNNPAPSG